MRAGGCLGRAEGTPRCSLSSSALGTRIKDSTAHAASARGWWATERNEEGQPSAGRQHLVFWPQRASLSCLRHGGGTRCRWKALSRPGVAPLRRERPRGHSLASCPLPLGTHLQHGSGSAQMWDGCEQWLRWPGRPLGISRHCWARGASVPFAVCTGAQRWVENKSRRELAWGWELFRAAAAAGRITLCGSSSEGKAGSRQGVQSLLHRTAGLLGCPAKAGAQPWLLGLVFPTTGS